MKKLPIGIQTFSEIRNSDYIYVDKTMYVHQVVTDGKYYFLSRPRRFGKSLLISTLMSLYKGEKELFEGLWIEDRWDWDRRNPVIHIPFSYLDYQYEGLANATVQRMQEIGQEYGMEIGADNPKAAFQELIKKLHAEYGKVAILIDEYDKPIIDYLGDEIEQAKENQQTLKTFYSVIKDADPYIELLFITGVSKFSKVSIFSDLNNLNDITMKAPYNDLLGYTQQELEADFAPLLEKLAEEQGMGLEETLLTVREWYNGYNWTGRNTLYNPFGILNLFDGMDFRNYWFATGTPTFLIDALKEQALYDVEGTEVGQRAFDSFEVKRDLALVPLLFQTGYLTIKEITEDRSYILGYPNREVKQSFLDYLLAGYSANGASQITPMILQLRNAFRKNDLELAMNLSNQLFRNLPHQLHAKTEQFYHAIIHLMYFYLGLYIESEVNTAFGRADSVVQTATHVYCFEFKFNQGTDAAIEQIKRRGYMGKYAHTGKEVLGLGVNFTAEGKGITAWKVLTADGELSEERAVSF